MITRQHKKSPFRRLWMPLIAASFLASFSRPYDMGEGLRTKKRDAPERIPKLPPKAKILNQRLERFAAGVDRLLAQFLLDADELVVFG